eukprot:Gb_16560 [translate_table: standard]
MSHFVVENTCDFSPDISLVSAHIVCTEMNFIADGICNPINVFNIQSDLLNVFSLGGGILVENVPNELRGFVHDLNCAAASNLCIEPLSAIASLSRIVNCQIQSFNTLA